jgi:hypothetical protein
VDAGIVDVMRVSVAASLTQWVTRQRRRAQGRRGAAQSCPGFRRLFREVTGCNAIVDDDLGIRQEIHRLNSGDQAGSRVA